MELSAISRQGLEQAQKHFERAAERIGSVSAGDPERMPVDTADLSSAAVDLLTARQEFTLNLKALKTADRLDRATLDLLA